MISALFSRKAHICISVSSRWMQLLYLKSLSFVTPICPYPGAILLSILYQDCWKLPIGFYDVKSSWWDRNIIQHILRLGHRLRFNLSVLRSPVVIQGPMRNESVAHSHAKWTGVSSQVVSPAFPERCQSQNRTRNNPGAGLSLGQAATKLGQIPPRPPGQWRFYGPTCHGCQLGTPHRYFHKGILHFSSWRGKDGASPLRFHFFGEISSHGKLMAQHKHCKPTCQMKILCGSILENAV